MPRTATETQRNATPATALAALRVTVALIATATYSINAWQVYGFARNVWHLPMLLGGLAAFLVDLFSVAGLFATHILRDAPRRSRVYAWSVFFGMTAVSIGAAEGFARWRHAGVWSLAASGVVVVALAASAHLLLVCQRYTDRVTASTRRVPVFTDVQPTGTPGVLVTRVTPSAATSPEPTRRKRDDRQGRALALLAAGRTAAEAGSAVGVSAGTVRTWLSRAGGRDALRVSTEAADGAGVITEAPEAAAVAAFPKGDHDPLHVTDLPSFRRNGHNGAAVTP